jgi:hypothetical protein
VTPHLILIPSIVFSLACISLAERIINRDNRRYLVVFSINQSKFTKLLKVGIDVMEVRIYSLDHLQMMGNFMNFNA